MKQQDKRENRIREYLDMLQLGDELYEADMRMVTRRTQVVGYIGQEKISLVVQERIEFS